MRAVRASDYHWCGPGDHSLASPQGPVLCWVPEVPLEELPVRLTVRRKDSREASKFYPQRPLPWLRDLKVDTQGSLCFQICPQPDLGRAGSPLGWRVVRPRYGVTAAGSPVSLSLRLSEVGLGVGGGRTWPTGALRSEEPSAGWGLQT